MKALDKVIKKIAEALLKVNAENALFGNIQKLSN